MYNEFDYKAFFNPDGAKSNDAGTPVDVTEEYLSKLLCYIGTEDSERLAEELVMHYGSLDRIISAELDELLLHLPYREAIFLKLVAYTNSRRTTDTFTVGLPYSIEELCRLAVSLFIGRSKETVYLISLDRCGRLLGIDNIGDGSANAAEIYPRRIVEAAVKRGATDAIIAHNHPSGAKEPSRADMSATARLYTATVSAGIRLRKHIVVAERECSVLDIDQQTGEVSLEGTPEKTELRLRPGFI